MIEAFREGQQLEVARDTEGELPEVKIFDLMSSVGNGEHHALDLIVMEEGVIYSAYAHYREMMSHQAKDRGWKTSVGLSFQHCQQALSPIGLVTREALSSGGSVWGHQISEYGLLTGKTLAGNLLKWSYEHPSLSLYKMLGSINSISIKDEQTLEKKRAQEARYKIFWEIATNPSNRIRLIDIQDAINDHGNSIKDHLISLKESGIISYEKTEHGESFSTFRRKEIIPDEEPKQYEYQKTLSVQLYDLLTSSLQQKPNGYLSVEEISNLLIQKYLEYKDLDKKSLSSRVAAILTNFEKQGHAERQKFSTDFRSEITLSDEQREVVVSFVTLLDNFKNGDRQTIEDGRRFAQRVLNDPRLFSELMFKAKEASPFANRTNREEIESWLISILQKHPNSTAEQILQALERDYDKKLIKSALNRHLFKLAQDTNPKITYEKTKSGNVYRVAEEENQTPSALN